MSRKLIGLTALAVSALLIVGCTRSASTAPLPTPTLEAFPQPEATATGMGLIEQLATQTAMASLNQPEGTQTTPEAVDPNVTPTETPLGGVPALPTLAGSNGATALPSPTPGNPIPTTVTIPQVTAGPTVQTVLPTSGSYTLQAGEFPYCIARRFNLDPQELLKLNGLSENVLYSPGLSVKLPTTGNPFPGQRSLIAHPASYTVNSGDTIYGIACKYGDVDPSNIASVNGLTAPYTLSVGQTLQIP